MARASISSGTDLVSKDAASDEGDRLCVDQVVVVLFLLLVL